MGYYVTTAIAYPNGAIHIGHAYEYIAADTIARFKRLDNHDVFFATGTDEHGLKMLQAANRLGITPKELADDNAKNFRDTQLALGSTFDRFIRTTDPDHYAASQEIWRRLEEAGDIYLDSYSGWYSVRDEAFYTEDETEVVDGVRLSKAHRFRYANRDMADLRAQLEAARDKGARRTLVVTDGAFSMDGFIAPLDEITRLAQQYGALVHIDECHATGFLGATGSQDGSITKDDTIVFVVDVLGAV